MAFNVRALNFSNRWRFVIVTKPLLIIDGALCAKLCYNKAVIVFINLYRNYVLVPKSNFAISPII